MSYGAQLWLFFVLVFGAVITPGLDMAFILGTSLSGGRRHGLAAVGGVIAGAAVHSVFATLGVSLLLQVMPAAFDVLLLAGACFIAWIGITIWRSPPPREDAQTVAAGPPWRSFLRALANNLLNPYAYLFSLGVFPQFIASERGPVALQAGALFAIIALTQASVYGTLVFAAAGVRRWLVAKPRAQAAVRRAVGAMLVLAAVLAAYAGLSRG